MCFAFDARPPDLPADLVLAPLAGGAGAELLELTAADGTRFSTALAEAPEGSDPGVVILPDVRGLYRSYVELAERFAQAGHHAIAIDYFGRTAGTGERDEDFDFWPHAEQTRVTQVHADADGARASSITSPRPAAPSSASSAAPTRRSRPARSRRSTDCSTRPASSTTSASTPMRRTRSST